MNVTAVDYLHDDLVWIFFSFLIMDNNEYTYFKTLPIYMTSDICIYIYMYIVITD